MSTVYWVRHGPTHQTAFTGWRDVPADLSDTAALQRLTDYLPREARIVSSDLRRTIATADAIANGRERLPHEFDLREFDFGAWDGMHFSDVAERDPELSRAFWETPGDVAAPDGESWNTVAVRAYAAIERIRGAAPDRPLIVVAHFGTILAHLNIAGGLSTQEAMSHKIDTLSVTEITHLGSDWRIDRINHLP